MDDPTRAQQSARPHTQLSARRNAKLLAVSQGQYGKLLTSFLTEGALAWNLHLPGQETSANQAHVMVISLQRYWQLKEAQRLAPVARYDEELSWANWNPEVPLLLQSSCQTQQEPSPQLPDNAAAVDVEGFLERVYALATNV